MHDKYYIQIKWKTNKNQLKLATYSNQLASPIGNTSEFCETRISGSRKMARGTSFCIYRWMLVAFLRASTSSLECINIPTRALFLLHQTLFAFLVGGILPNRRKSKSREICTPGLQKMARGASLSRFLWKLLAAQDIATDICLCPSTSTTFWGCMYAACVWPVALLSRFFARSSSAIIRGNEKI